MKIKSKGRHLQKQARPPIPWVRLNSFASLVGPNSDMVPVKSQQHFATAIASMADFDRFAASDGDFDSFHIFPDNVTLTRTRLGWIFDDNDDDRTGYLEAHKTILELTPTTTKLLHLDEWWWWLLNFANFWRWRWSFYDDDDYVFLWWTENWKPCWPEQYQSPQLQQPEKKSVFKLSCQKFHMFWDNNTNATRTSGALYLGTQWVYAPSYSNSSVEFLSRSITAS